MKFMRARNNTMPVVVNGQEFARIENPTDVVFDEVPARSILGRLLDIMQQAGSVLTMEQAAYQVIQEVDRYQVLPDPPSPLAL